MADLASIVSDTPATNRTDAIQAEARAVAERNGIDPNLFLGLVQQESQFNPGAVSSKGAVGLTQLRSAAAREVGVDRTDPLQNLEGGAIYLKKQIDRFGDMDAALAAYNAGPGKVQSVGGKIPNIPETIDYVQKVKQYAAQFASALGPSEAKAAEPTDLATIVGNTPASDLSSIVAGTPAADSAGGITAEDIQQYFHQPSIAQASLAAVADTPFGVLGRILQRGNPAQLLMDNEARKKYQAALTRAEAQYQQGRQDESQLGILPGLVPQAISVAGLAPFAELGPLGFGAVGAATGGLRATASGQKATDGEVLKEAGKEGAMNLLFALGFKGAGQVGAALVPGSRAVQLASQVGAGAIGGGLTGGPKGAIQGGLLGIPFGAMSDTRPGLKDVPMGERFGEVFNPAQVLPFGTGLEQRQVGARMNLEFTDPTLAESTGQQFAPGESVPFIGGPGMMEGFMSRYGTEPSAPARETGPYRPVNADPYGLGVATEGGQSEGPVLKPTRGTAYVYDVATHGLRSQSRLIPEAMLQTPGEVPPHSIDESVKPIPKVEEPSLFIPAGKIPRRIKSDEGYVYHATNEERLLEIVNTGELKTHEPSYGTDQKVWPDGSIEPRSYFSRNAGVVGDFSPVEGKPVIIRIKYGPKFKEELYTGDIYSRQSIPTEQIEYLGVDDQWHQIKQKTDVPRDYPGLLKDAIFNPPKPEDFPVPDYGKGMKAKALTTEMTAVQRYLYMESVAHNRFMLGQDPLAIPESVKQAAQREIRTASEAAEAGGTAPNGFADATSDPSRPMNKKLEDVVAAQGRTAVMIEDVPEELIPKWIMPKAGAYDVTKLSKADAGVLFDADPVGFIAATLATPKIVMARDARSLRIFEELSLADHQKKVLLDKWLPAMMDSLSEPGRLGRQRLLKAEDLELIGKALDGDAEAKKAVGLRPDLGARADKLRTVLNEVADLAGIAPDQFISDYFPRFLKLYTDLVVELPTDVAFALGSSTPLLNERLRLAFDNMGAAEIKVIRDMVLNKKHQAEVVIGPASTKAKASEVRAEKASHLQARADEVAAVMREVLDATGKHGKEGAEFIRQYLTSVLRQDELGRKVANSSVEIQSLLPGKKLFFGPLSAERVDLNPAYLDYNAYNVLRIYLYGAARKIALDAHLPTIREMVDDMNATIGRDHSLTKYSRDLLDNYMGRNKQRHNEWLANRLKKSTIVKAMSESDLKGIRAIGRALQLPNPASKIANFIKMVEFSSKIGLNAVTPIINSTQPLVNVTPIVGERWMAASFLHFTNWGGYRQIKNFSVQDGVLDHPGYFDFRPEVFAGRTQKFVRLMATVFSKSEQNNRGWTYVAGFMKRMHDLQPDIKSGKYTPEMAQKAARLYAKELVSRTQFEGGKLGQGLGLQTPVGMVMGQFKTFTIKEIELWRSLSWKERAHAVAILYALGGNAVLPLIKKLDPDNELLPDYNGLLGMAGLDVSRQLGVGGLLGVPSDTRELGQTLGGPFASDVVSNIGGGMENLPQNLARFAPGGVQIRRYIQNKGDPMAQIFGAQTAGR